MFAQEFFEIKDNMDKRVVYLKKEIGATSKAAATKSG